MSNTFSSKVSGNLSSRGWAIALGIGAIVLATILLIVYLDRYRARVGGRNAPTPVLVAKQTIPLGTTGAVVQEQQMYIPRTLPKKEVEADAISDPAFLTGRAAAVEILPGQQITALDFAADPNATVTSQLTGTQRAISISIDAIHGSLAQVRAGDTVDIYMEVGGQGPNAQSVVKLFKPNVKILTIPTAAGTALTIRMDTKDVAQYMYAADHARLYFALRPAAGAAKTKPSSATAASLLSR
jgi:Flp pilus assembly protein CpaB